MDILFISETKLDSTFKQGQFDVPGYKHLRKDRNAHGVGILAYFRADLPARQRQDIRIQKFEADGSQRDGAATLQGRGSGIHVNLWDSFVGKEEMYVRDGLHLSGKGAAVFAEGHK